MIEQKQRNQRRMKEGVVISNKMEKTVVVQVMRLVEHPKFGKRIKRVKKYYAHDEGNSLQIGERVSIVETRPLSKSKRWRVVCEKVEQS